VVARGPALRDAGELPFQPFVARAFVAFGHAVSSSRCRSAAATLR
jgi:hypothetical protein